MRILITGASGFIGGHLVEQALARGMDVTAAIRTGSDTSRIMMPQVKLLQLDLGNAEKLSQQVKDAGKFDYIIHNAGVTKALNAETYYAVNQGITANFIKALQATGLSPERFIFVSSLAAFGPALNTDRVYQTQTAQPVTHYGKSKLAAEQWIEKNGTNFPWTIARPAAVYGPGDRDIFQFISMINKGLEVTAGADEQRLSFIHGADAARALIDLAASPKSLHQAYFLSDGIDYTNKQLAEAAKSATNREKTLKIHLSTGMLRVVASIVEFFGRLSGKPSALNKDKVAELAAENWLCDSSNLFSDTRFKPQFDLKSGIADTVNWYRAQGWMT